MCPLLFYITKESTQKQLNVSILVYQKTEKRGFFSENAPKSFGSFCRCYNECQGGLELVQFVIIMNILFPTAYSWIVTNCSLG